MERKIPRGKRTRKPGPFKGVYPTLGAADKVFLAGTKFTRRREHSDVPDAKTVLADEGLATVRRYRKNDVISLQGGPADALFYVQDGTVKLSILSRQGNEATIALLSGGEFFGEGCVTAEPALCSEAAIALTDCCVLRITRRNALRVLHRMHPLLASLIAFLITRNRRVQEDLADQLFNSAEKRLARTLLLLAGLDDGGRTERVIPNVSQQILAEMIGVTRQRVNFFMNRFRKLGFIEYNHEIKVRQSLRSVLLHD
jgi:CRP-like cAMP-binding protein